jgi:ubiquinone/menaquinone biosynthesis C-methylase UbiE
MPLRNLLLIDGRACPWWLAPSFDNPLRRLVHNPETILADLVQEGQTVADIGCGMGYFTLPLARRVGPHGRVIAIDLQEKMFRSVRKRLVKAGLLERVALQQVQPTHLGLSEPLDFALAFWMVHEFPDQYAFLSEVRGSLKSGAGLLVVEPMIHVSAPAFQRTIEVAEAVGLKPARMLESI